MNKEMSLDMREGEGIRTGVDVFVLNEQEQLLLGLRKARAGENTWGFPGGHQRTGEMIHDTAIRELREELGGQVQIELINEVVAVRENQIKPWYVPHITIILKAYYGGGEIVNNPQERTVTWNWFSLDNLPPQLFSGVEETVQNYKQGLSLVVSDWHIKP
ncbi:NUDIX domain-containing protein [Candidatus Microgenomates bacterium]|nr:NUDIX domain-containing protein [Candidatus Microgenomates bacterium]